MKRIITTIAACLVLMSSLSAQRVIERLGRRLERVAEETAEEIIGKKLEQKFSEFLEELYTMGEDSTKIRVEEDRIILTEKDGTEVELTSEPDEEVLSNVEASSWVGRFVMELREYKGDREQKDSPMTVTYYINPYDVAIDVPTDEGDARMIMHRQTRKITMLMTDEDGNKTGTKMPMLRIKTTVSSAEGQTEEHSITETGNTKTISGYLCREYEVETEDMTGTMWITKQWELDYGVLFDFAQVKNANTGQVASWSNVFGAPGIMMESKMKERNSDKTMVYRILEVDQGAQSEAFSTEGYEMTDMGSLFGR